MHRIEIKLHNKVMLLKVNRLAKNDSSALKVDTHINYAMGVKKWQKYSVKNE